MSTLSDLVQAYEVSPAIAAFWQQDAWMTPHWQASFGRRNLVEGAFGNLKNDPAQDITRGRIHVMGRAKTTLMLAFAMAHNLRIAAISATRATAHRAPRTAHRLHSAGATPARLTRKPSEPGTPEPRPAHA